MCESNYDMNKSYKNYFAKVTEISDYFSEEQEDARANSNDYINSLSSNAKKEWARKMSYGSDLEL